ncbi:hypothetical protein [Fischerella sp. FACHB-380]|nr:hypothetical protein [Fischerella sp. FACHB-380]
MTETAFLGGWSHQPPTINNQQSTTNHQPPTINHQPLLMTIDF